MTHVRFEFQPLTEANLPLLHLWLLRPHLRKWWSADELTLDAVRDEYLPDHAAENATSPFLAYLSGEPIGYVQSYSAYGGTPGWWPDNPGPGVFGIDQFIADENQLNKGLGTAMVSQFAKLLFENPEITEIRVDPKPENSRAIRCYLKVGFKETGPICTPDGPAIMMVLKRPSPDSKPVG